jgi:hypothetical protein
MEQFEFNTQLAAVRGTECTGRCCGSLLAFSCIGSCAALGKAAAELPHSKSLLPNMVRHSVTLHLDWSWWTDSRKTWPTMASVLGLILSSESCGVCQ